MIGLDTNVLIRYILQDDPQQAAAASRLIEEICTEKHPALINHIVLCETVWVLRYSYGYERGQITIVLKQILSTDCFAIPARAVAWKAVYDYETQQGDFADFIILHTNKSLDTKTTFTFDKKAARHPGFTLLKSSR